MSTSDTGAVLPAGTARAARIDVAIPCYQYGHFLREGVASVLNQGVDDIRIVIIDNASTDDSVEVAQELARGDSRIEVVRHARNLGPTTSYNEAIDWARSEYFVLLDADDLLAPGCLARALPFMESRPDCAFTYGFEALLYPDGGMRTADTRPGQETWTWSDGQQFIRQLCKMPKNFIGAPTVVRRTAIQKSIGYYRPELPYSDDLEMWLRLATAGGVAETKEVQGIRRVHAQQMSSEYRKSWVRDLEEREAAFASFFAREGRALPDHAELMREARDALASNAYWSALSHYCRGIPAEGYKLLKFSLARRPSAAVMPPVGWLFRMHDPVARLGEVLRESGLNLWQPARKTNAP